MRRFGTPDILDQIPMPPDTVGRAVISSAGDVSALDKPSGARIVCFGSTMSFWLHMSATSVAIPTTDNGGSTSQLSEYVPSGLCYQIPSGSTGLSITAATSGVISLAYWSY